MTRQYSEVTRQAWSHTVIQPSHGLCITAQVGNYALCAALCSARDQQSKRTYCRSCEGALAMLELIVLHCMPADTITEIVIQLPSSNDKQKR